MRPHRQQSVHTLLAVSQHGGNHVGVAFGLQQVEQGMQGAVGVPQREHGVIGESFGLMDVVVQPSVLPIDVHIHRRVDHGVIERGVEHGFLVVAALGLKDAQFFVPFVLGFGQQCVEVASVGLGVKVFQGAFGAHCRQGHFHFQGLGLLKREIGHDFASCHLGEVVSHVEFAPHAVVFGLLQFPIPIVGEGLAEADGEVGVVGPGPSVGDAVSGEQGVVFDPKVGPEGLAVVVVDGVLQVEQHAAVLS